MIDIQITDQMASNILDVRLRVCQRINYKNHYDLHMTLENHSGVAGERICIRDLSEDSLSLLAETIKKVLRKEHYDS
jgi:hypothetical protein